MSATGAINGDNRLRVRRPSGIEDCEGLVGLRDPVRCQSSSCHSKASAHLVQMHVYRGAMVQSVCLVLLTQ